MSLAAPLDDYEGFCRGVARLTGIDLLQYKRGQMERRVRSFASKRAAGDDLTAYLGLIKDRPEELEAFLDRVTINVSQLWRNPEQWQLLQTQILPELAGPGGATRVRAWSAGASYGAEAFTLAAVARSAIPRAPLEIVGTDIDRRMVARARRGWFSADDARDAPPAQLRRWFAQDGDGWRAKPELVAHVKFEVGDLLTVRPAANRFDLVLCRNTVIYFKEEVRDELHARLAASLRPGGILLVGSTERVTDPSAAGLVPVRPFIYRKDG